MLVSEYLEQHGLSGRDVTARLAEHGVLSQQGNPIKPSTITAMVKRGQKIPSRWHGALGIGADPFSGAAAPGEPAAAPEGESGATPGRRESSPRRPAEAPIAVVEPGAAKRIAGAYKFVGAALAAGAQPSIGALPAQGIAQVFSDQSDKIAELWLEAAKENPWAARFVNVMQAGGPMGDLAAAHLYLAGACAYVVGAGIPGGDAIFPRYSRFRPVVEHKPSRNGAAAAEPAASDEPAEGPVVDASV